MKNLSRIGRSLSTKELKETMAGRNVLTHEGDCSPYSCPSGFACNVYGDQCIPNGGGGGDICPENVGMQC